MTTGSCSFVASFDIQSFSVHISRPDESSDQSAIGVFRSGGPAHGARDLDATPKERRLGSGVWRGGHGEHFRRANDERAGEVYDLAGWHFLRAYVGVVGFVRASGHRRGERIPARADETASCSGYFSPRGDPSGFARFFSSEFANSGVSCFFSGVRRATNSDAVRPGVSLKRTRKTALQSSIFPRQFGSRPLPEDSRKSSPNCYFFVLRL